jgi:hypothetical protein
MSFTSVFTRSSNAFKHFPLLVIVSTRENAENTATGRRAKSFREKLSKEDYGIVKNQRNFSKDFFALPPIARGLFRGRHGENNAMKLNL